MLICVIPRTATKLLPTVNESSNVTLGVKAMKSAVDSMPLLTISLAEKCGNRYRHGLQVFPAELRR